MEVKHNGNKEIQAGLENAAVGLAGASLVLSLLNPVPANAFDGAPPPALLSSVSASPSELDPIFSDAGAATISAPEVALVDIAQVRKGVPVSIHWLGVNIPGAKLDLFHSEFNGRVGLRLTVRGIITEAKDNDYIYPARIIPMGDRTRIIFGEGPNQVEAEIRPTSEVRMTYYPSNSPRKMVRAVVSIKDKLPEGERQQEITFLGAPGQALETEINISQTTRSKINGRESLEVSGPASVIRTDLSILAHRAADSKIAP